MERYCNSPHCTKLAVPQRTICSTCSNKRYRKKYPIKALYDNLKSNASRRGVHFGITLNEWIIFCAETDYHNLKGIHGNDYTVDRKDPNVGYVYSNLQILTRIDNAKKNIVDQRKKRWKSGVTEGEVPF